MPEACPACGGTDFDVNESSGDTICVACGNVLEQNAIVSSIEFAETAGGSSSVIGQFVSGTSNRAFGSGGPSLNVSQISREIAIDRGRRMSQQLAAALRLSSHFVDAAQRLYILALQRNFIQGRRISHVVAACLYIACRREKSAHMLIDFADALQTNLYTLGSCFVNFTQLLALRLPIVDPSLYIHRFAAKLEFGDKTHAVSMTALRLVARMRRDWMLTGRRPEGICAASLLIAARIHGFRRTRQEVVQLLRVADFTLRQRLAEFENTPASLLTPDEFDELGEQQHRIGNTDTSDSIVGTLTDVEMVPPAFIRSNLKEHKCIQLQQAARERAQLADGDLSKESMFVEMSGSELDVGTLDPQVLDALERSQMLTDDELVALAEREGIPVENIAALQETLGTNRNDDARSSISDEQERSTPYVQHDESSIRQEKYILSEESRGRVLASFLSKPHWSSGKHSSSKDLVTRYESATRRKLREKKRQQLRLLQVHQRNSRAKYREEIRRHLLSLLENTTISSHYSSHFESEPLQSLSTIELPTLIELACQTKNEISIDVLRQQNVDFPMLDEEQNSTTNESKSFSLLWKAPTVSEHKLQAAEALLQQLGDGTFDPTNQSHIVELEQVWYQALKHRDIPESKLSSHVFRSNWLREPDDSAVESESDSDSTSSFDADAAFDGLIPDRQERTQSDMEDSSDNETNSQLMEEDADTDSVEETTQLHTQEPASTEGYPVDDADDDIDDFKWESWPWIEPEEEGIVMKLRIDLDQPLSIVHRDIVANRNDASHLYIRPETVENEHVNDVSRSKQEMSQTYLSIAKEMATILSNPEQSQETLSMNKQETTMEPDNQSIVVSTSALERRLLFPIERTGTKKNGALEAPVETLDPDQVVELANKDFSVPAAKTTSLGDGTTLQEDDEMLSDVDDDDELDDMIIDEQEAKDRERIWREMNAEYLEERKQKESAAIESGAIPTHLRHTTSRSGASKTTQTTKGTQAAGAGSESTEVTTGAAARKVSRKLNYDALQNLDALLGSAQDNPENEFSETIPSMTQASEPKSTPMLTSRKRDSIDSLSNRIAQSSKRSRTSSMTALSPRIVPATPSVTPTLTAAGTGTGVRTGLQKRHALSTLSLSSLPPAAIPTTTSSSKASEHTEHEEEDIDDGNEEEEEEMEEELEVAEDEEHVALRHQLGFARHGSIDSTTFDEDAYE